MIEDPIIHSDPVPTLVIHMTDGYLTVPWHLVRAFAVQR